MPDLPGPGIGVLRDALAAAGSQFTEMLERVTDPSRPAIGEDSARARQRTLRQSLFVTPCRSSELRDVERDDMRPRLDPRVPTKELLAVEPRHGLADHGHAHADRRSGTWVDPAQHDAAKAGRDLAVRIFLEREPRRMLREAVQRVDAKLLVA